MNRYIIKLTKSGLLFLVSAFLISFSLQAQQYNSLYWMQGIPQSSYSNPGLQPRPNFYLGIPGASSVYFGFANTGFAVKDFLKKETNGSFYIDDQGLLSALDKRNYLQSDLQVEALAFGFRSKRDYFSFNATVKYDIRFGYPKDLMHLLIEGNDSFLQRNEPADLGGLSINTMLYSEFGLGYSRKWTDELTAGLRLKALMGLGVVNFEKSELTLTTQQNTYGLLTNADLLVNTGLPFLLSPIDSLGNKDDDYFDIEPLEYIRNNKNRGFAIDLGGSYQINDMFSVALSVIDLGFINWKTNTENFQVNGEFEFNGIDFNDFFRSEDAEDEDPFGGILDSIRDIFDIEETTRTFRTMLPTKVFLSAAFHPTKFHKFAVLGRGEFYKGNLLPSFTLSYNFQPIPQFGTSLSYSVIHWNYNNLGLGFHLNLLPIQVYLVMDNVWPAARPHTFQTFTLHAGVNFVIGYRTKKDISAPSFRW